MPVAIIVNPGTTGIPARLRSGLDQPRPFCNIQERSIAVVTIKGILPIVGDEQIVITVVVVVADATRLSPTGADFETRTLRHIGERSVAVVLEQMTMRFFALGEAFEAPSIYEEHVEPAVVIVVVEAESAARRFQQILVLPDTAVDSFDVEPRTFDDIHEADTEWRAFDWGFRTRWWRSGLGLVATLDRPNILSCAILWDILLLRSGQSQNICEWKYKSGTAQRAKKLPAIQRQHESSSASAARPRW